MTDAEIITRAQEVFDVEIEGLRRTRAALGPAFVRAVERMLACTAAGGKVVVSGVGKSLHMLGHLVVIDIQSYAEHAFLSLYLLV